jgi:hypothetical protein
MRTLATRLGSLAEEVGDAPWAGYEFVRGWGVFGMPFDSGHVLALRVFPQNSFTPYRTVWHRDPAGRWSILVDAATPDVACPRYFAAACDHVGYARIAVSWPGPRTVRVSVDEPELEWTMTVRRAPLPAVLNALSGMLPLASWRLRSFVRMRQGVARMLGMGRLELSGETPSGHDGLLMPRRMYLVDRARATLGGVDLGRPVRLAGNPVIGGVPVSARGVLAVGQAVWRIKDQDEFDRARARARDALQRAGLAAADLDVAPGDGADMG